MSPARTSEDDARGAAELERQLTRRRADPIARGAAEQYPTLILRVLPALGAGARRALRDHLALAARRREQDVHLRRVQASTAGRLRDLVRTGQRNARDGLERVAQR